MYTYLTAKNKKSEKAFEQEVSQIELLPQH
jgi:hypothetical protein